MDRTSRWFLWRCLWASTETWSQRQARLRREAARRDELVENVGRAVKAAHKIRWDLSWRQWLGLFAVLWLVGVVYAAFQAI